MQGVFFCSIFPEYFFFQQLPEQFLIDIVCICIADNRKHLIVLIMKIFNCLILIASIILIGACNTGNPKVINKEPQPIAGYINLSNKQLKIPEGWEQAAPSNNMRYAQLQKIGSPEVQIAIFYFGPQDMKEQNISRWKGQYSKIETYEELTVPSPEVTAIRILGTYKQKPFPMAKSYTEVENFGTLAAIVNSTDGPYYLRLDSKNELIKDFTNNFLAMFE